MDVPKSYNKTIYILRRSDNPDFHDCSGLYLRSEYNELKEWKFWVYGVASSVLVILGILGNALATFILHKPRMKSAFNQLLIVLCAIDSLFLLTNIPTITQSQGSNALKSIKGYVNVLGQVSVCASVFMIVALSYERHFAICSPHAYRIHLRTVPRWKHLIVYLVPVMIASILVNVPKIINLKTEMMKNVTYVKVNLYLRYFHPLTTTGWLPIFLLIFLNIKISRGIKNLQRPRKITRAEDTETNGENESSQVQRSNKRHLKEIRATQLAIGIVVTFATLNLPRIIASTVEISNTDLIIKCVENNVRYIHTLTFYKLDVIAHMLMILNSAVNVIVYCAVSTPFQEEIMNCLCPTSWENIISFKTRTVRTILVFSEEVHRQDELEMMETRENEDASSASNKEVEIKLLARIDEEIESVDECNDEVDV